MLAPGPVTKTGARPRGEPATWSRRKMKFFLSKLTHLIVVFFGISVLTFLLIRALPGDPALALAAQSGAADPQLIAEDHHRPAGR